MIRAFLVCFFLLLSSGIISAQIAVQGDKVYTMAGKTFSPGVVLLKGEKIEAIGSPKDITIPSEYRLMKAAVVIPGLVDAHSVVGLSGILNSRHDQDQLEKSAPMQPELRAIDAYNGRDPLISWIRQFGVTTVHTGHAPGALVSGQTMITKTIGNSVEENILVSTAMVAATVGEGAMSSEGSPGTSSKVIAMLRSELLRVQNIQNQRTLKTEEKDSPPPSRNLRDEVWEKILNRDIPLLVTAHRHQDILSALRVAKEFNIHVILDGVADAYLVINELQEAKISVILHPTMARANGERENLSMETASILQKVGIPFALQSGYEAYVPKTRVVLFEAAIAAAYGLSFEEALASITISAAKILGVQERVGSLEVGKDADLALYDGDPFEYTTHCTGVIINGQVVSEEAH